MAVAEKTKEKVIVITDLKSSLKEFARAYERASRGEEVERDTIGVSNPKELQTLLSPKRLELLRAIKEHKPRSIKELAGLVKRDVRNVHRDLVILEAVGLVELEKKGKEVKPIVDYDEIVIRI
ncbi:MAG TPA: ArsR family transcriptional regulator [Aquifex aeolicus]|uniref:ArsR family transcriptional regulator n=1 Tax=Aquifex aeolicus TaxID=63363 RepID=A0A7C5LAN1_AQUAO|nr:ArsR family transcriptional regulator [Aquifex aeolicus]